MIKNKCTQISYGDTKPEMIIDLNSGYYYYNYNILVEVVPLSELFQMSSNADTFIDNEEHTYKYTYILVRINGMPTINKCYTAILESYVNEDGTSLLDILNSPVKTSEDELLSKDIYELIEVEFGVRDKPTELQLEKTKILRLVEIYDCSTEVNSFFLNNMQVWLDKATRVGLMNSLNIEKESGRTISTLWFGNIKLTISTESAMTMLSLLELYALECYNKTAEHKTNINNLSSVEEVSSYDYTAGYPEKLSFNI